MENKIRICIKLKRLRDCDIYEKTKILRQEKITEQQMEAAAWAKPEFQKLIRQSTRQMWSDYLQNLRGADDWRVAKYCNCQPGTMVEAQTDRDDNHANTAIEKEVMLR